MCNHRSGKSFHFAKENGLCPLASSPLVRKSHPHLGLIVVEDGLSSNGPHICPLFSSVFSSSIRPKNAFQPVQNMWSHRDPDEIHIRKCEARYPFASNNKRCTQITAVYPSHENEKWNQYHLYRDDFYSSSAGRFKPSLTNKHPVRSGNIPHKLTQQHEC